MTKTRSLIVASIASLLLVAGLAHAARPLGRVAQTKDAIAAHLNRTGEFPPNAMMSPYTRKDIRIRTKATLVTGIVGNQLRDVKWTAGPQTRAGKLAGTAQSQTVVVPNAPTTVSNIVVTNRPWTPAPNW